MSQKRYAVFVDDKIAKDITKYAKDAGIKETYFRSLALTVGARMLARSLNPEKFITPDVWAQIIKAAQAEGLDVSQLEKVKQ